MGLSEQTSSWQVQRKGSRIEFPLRLTWGKFRLLGGGDIWEPGSSGRLQGQACFGLRVIQKSPLRHPTAPPGSGALGWLRLGSPSFGLTLFPPAADPKMTVSPLFALELVAELGSWFQVLSLPQLARCEVGQTAGLHCACSPWVQWGAAATPALRCLVKC